MSNDKKLVSLDGLTILTTALNNKINDSIKEEANRASAKEAELQAAINEHTHDDEYCSEAEINSKLADKADAEHAHDDKYYTETEIDGKLGTLNTAISNKADKTHGNHVPDVETANNAKFLRNDNTWQTVTPENIGAAKASHGTHVTYATSTPKANGTAAVGSSSDVARADHVHPLQTSVSGNAGSADEAGKLATAVNITVGNKTNSFDGSENINFTLADIGAAQSSHNHDDRYYTESEINTKVSNLQAEIDADVKAEADRAKEAEAALQAAIDGKAVSGHTHDDRYYTESEVDTKLSGKSDTGHTHDDRYYTETEIDGKINTINNAINTAKSDAQSYADQKITALVDSAPDAMNTLNELAAAINNHQDVYDAYVEEVSAKLTGKSDTGHTHDDRYYTESEINTKLSGKSDTGHAHDDKYYTETEIDGKITTLNNAINGKADSSHGNHVPAVETANNAKFLRNDNTWATVTPDNIGAAKASHGTHVTWSTTTPKVAGTASVGSETNVARGDHVHPAQTSVSGNAGTATKLQNARNITIGDKTNSFDGSGNISYTLADIGAAAANHGKHFLETGLSTNFVNEYRTNIKGNADNGPFLSVLRQNNNNVEFAPQFGSGIGWGKEDTHGYLYTSYNQTKAWIGGGNQDRLIWTKELSFADHTHDYASSNHGTHVTYSTSAPLVAGTASVGSAANVARGDHVHPAQTSVSGNAGTATKLQNAKTITIGNKGNSFDGSENISYSIADIGAAPASHNHTSLTDITSLAFKVEGSDAGSISTTIESNHTYFDFNLSDDPEQSDMWRWRFSPSGGTVFNAMTLDPTTTTAAKLSVTGNVTATSFTENGTALSDKYAAKSHGTHVGDAYATATPKVAGTAAVGTSTKVAREDHVHPVQTSVSGNAGTATKLQNARTLTIGNSGKSFDGSGNVSWSLSEIGAASTLDAAQLWQSKITCLTWSRLFKFASADKTTGGSFFVNIQGTRSNVVFNTTFIVNFSHSQKCFITQLNNTDYSSFKVRAVVDSDGAGYFEMYDDATHATNTTTQSIIVTVTRLSGNTTFEKYTTFTNGTTIPSEYAVKSELTTVAGSVYTGKVAVADKATKLESARTITIGNKGNNFDGSGNISYSLAEIGASPLQKSVIQKTKSGTTLTLSTDRYQKATLNSGDTIALPTVNDFTEINLFVKDCTLTSINIPDNCKWRVDPNLSDGTSYMFTFIYTTQEWLAEIKIYS